MQNIPDLSAVETLLALSELTVFATVSWFILKFEHSIRMPRNPKPLALQRRNFDLVENNVTRPFLRL